MTYDDIRTQLSAMISRYRAEEEPKCKLRRELRRADADLDELRRTGKLSADETFIPQRIIDRRIKEEIPTLLRIVTQAQRFLVLKSKTGRQTANIEKAFTSAMKYPGWEIPWVRLFDSVLLHGGAAIEVIFDPAKPGNCTLEYIRREDFIFPVEARNLHMCEMVARRYVYPIFKFESFVRDYGFSEKIVKEITQGREETPASRSETINVYKVYRRTSEGHIEMFWYAENATDYLREPEPLSLGIIDFDRMRESSIIQERKLTDFPVFWMPYEVIEDDSLLSSKGRAFRDAPDQEALTQLWTALINASIKASGIFGSLENTFNASGLALGETTKLEKDKIHPSKVNFFSVQFPTGDLLMTAMRYGIVSASTSGRIDVAVANRPDSRKTAREISEITELQSQINNMTSTAQMPVLLNVYKLCFEIYRSSLLFELPPNLTLEDVLDDYEVEHSGSFELIEREQRKSTIVSMLPYLGNTQLATVVLQYLVEQYFPDKYKEWNAILQDKDPVVLLSAVAPVLQATMQLVPQDSKVQLQSLLNEIQAYLQRRGAAPVLPMGESPNDTAPQEGAA